MAVCFVSSYLFFGLNVQNVYMVSRSFNLIDVCSRLRLHWYSKGSHIGFTMEAPFSRCRAVWVNPATSASATYYVLPFFFPFLLSLMNMILKVYYEFL